MESWTSGQNYEIIRMFRNRFEILRVQQLTKIKALTAKR